MPVPAAAPAPRSGSRLIRASGPSLGSLQVCLVLLYASTTCAELRSSQWMLAVAAAAAAPMCGREACGVLVQELRWIGPPLEASGQASQELRHFRAVRLAVSPLLTVTLGLLLLPIWPHSCLRLRGDLRCSSCTGNLQPASSILAALLT